MENTTRVANHNISVDVTPQERSHLTRGDDTSLSVTDAFENITLPGYPVITTELPETVSIHVIVTRTPSVEVPMDNTDWNMERTINTRWNVDANHSSEPDTDATSAAAASATTRTTTPPPTPVIITAESLAGVRMSLTDARHKARDALENYVSRPKSEWNLLDYTQVIINIS